MVVLPSATPVAVIVLPDKLAVATPVLLDCTYNVPSPLYVIVDVFGVVPTSDRLVGLSDKVGVALPMLHSIVFGASEPSSHLYPAFTLNVVE